MPKELTLDEKTIFKKNHEIQEIKTDEEKIISPANPKDECIYYLDNEVSCKIWNLIDGKNPLSRIKEALSCKFTVDERGL